MKSWGTTDTRNWRDGTKTPQLWTSRREDKETDVGGKENDPKKRDRNQNQNKSGRDLDVGSENTSTLLDQVDSVQA